MSNHRGRGNDPRINIAPAEWNGYSTTASRQQLEQYFINVVGLDREQVRTELDKEFSGRARRERPAGRPEESWSSGSSTYVGSDDEPEDEPRYNSNSRRGPPGGNPFDRQRNEGGRSRGAPPRSSSGRSSGRGRPSRHDPPPPYEERGNRGGPPRRTQSYREPRPNRSSPWGGYEPNDGGSGWEDTGIRIEINGQTFREERRPFDPSTDGPNRGSPWSGQGGNQGTWN